MNEKISRMTPKESGNPDILKMLALSILSGLVKLKRNSLFSRMRKD